MKKVLIIGSGAAGLSCAIECARRGIYSVVISPYYSERAQSVMAAGGINASAGEPDSVEAHVMDTLKGGCFLESEEAVRGLCSCAPAIVDNLEHIGVVFSRDEKGRVDRRLFGGQSHLRTAYSGTSTGKQIISALVRLSRMYESRGLITRLTGGQFHSALISDGVCHGALIYDMRKNTLVPYYADALVMATGGQNALFGKTTGTTLCDGYAAGKLFEQGVQLKNLEFIQYHPTTIETPQKRMLISEAARGEGGRLYYLDGEKRVYFMEELYGEKGNVMTRDVVSRCIYKAPSQVYLDISFLGPERIHSRLGEVYDVCRRYLGIDVTKESIPVYPSVHYFMGGIAVDIHHRTNISRLYAIGECASIYHGANRLGGNSLLGAIYGGYVCAGDVSGLDSLRIKEMPSYIRDCQEDLRQRLERKSRFPSVYLRQMVSDAMNTGMGMVRNEEGLRECLDTLDAALSYCEKLWFDPELSPYQSFSLRSMISLARGCVMSALYRKESRGAHFRSDYPETKDEFRRPTLAAMEDGSIKITGGELLC